MELRRHVSAAVGNTGSSKTRLLKQACGRARNQDMQVYGCGYDEEMTLPSLLWGRHLLAKIVQFPQESPEELQEKVEIMHGFLRPWGGRPSTPNFTLSV